MCPGTCPYCGGTGTITEEYYNAERESMEQHKSKCPALVEGTYENEERERKGVLNYLSSTMEKVASEVNKAIN